MEVLVFQIIIFLIVIIASLFSKKSHLAITGLLLLFTLIMVFTVKLMIIQFLTIGVAYLISRKPIKKKAKPSETNKPEVNYPSKKEIEKLKKELPTPAKIKNDPTEPKNLNKEEVLKNAKKLMRKKAQGKQTLIKLWAAKKITKDFFNQVKSYPADLRNLIQTKINELNEEDFTKSKDKLFWSIDKYEVFKKVLISNLNNLGNQIEKKEINIGYEDFLNKIKKDYYLETNSFEMETGFISDLPISRRQM